MAFNPRTLLVILHDLTAASLAWLGAYWLRFNLDLPGDHLQPAVINLVWIVAVQGIVFYIFGLYRGIWRFASLPDLKRILKAVAVAALLVPVMHEIFHVKDIVPRSVLILDPILLVLMMGGSRLAYRSWKEHRIYGYGLMQDEREPVLILGAGESAAGLIKELERSREWRVEGILDDTGAKPGRLIQGVKILGGIEQLQYWAERYETQVAIIAMPSQSHQARRRAAEICTEAGIKPMTVPSYDDLVSGKVTVSQIRTIELDDLLGRDPIKLDDAGLHSLLTGKVVMVTGAGGSIGSELCRQIVGFSPSLLVLYELNEFALYQIEQEFRSRFPNLLIACTIGDVKDRTRLDQVLDKYRPVVIFHAAAYKHVPLMEQENSWQAVRNNVLGTSVLGLAAIAHGVEKLVLISTDKAVNPTNVMGASKRLAEMVCQGLQAESLTRFVMVRFGNVLGSTGSVIPKFREQIANGGPVTVTHPEITRYFMSIPEAAQLVLQAGLMGDGGEIFVLDMGEPVKIADLAKDMIRLSGFSEDDIKIIYTGLRPGEKLFEELLADDEHTLPTPHPKLRIAKAREVQPQITTEVIDWLQQGSVLADEVVRLYLKKWIPEYQCVTSSQKASDIIHEASSSTQLEQSIES